VDRPARQVRLSTSDNGTADAQDLALVKAIQAGDTGSWSKLLIRYQDRLFGVCMRMVGDRERAADLTQDAMVRIIEGIKSYDGRAKLSTWMIRVTMNVCLSKLRSEKLRRHASLDAGLETRSGKPGVGGGAGGTGWVGRSASERVPDEQTREPAAELRIEREETRRLVAAALLRILPEQRAILVLRDSKGLEYEQIAEVLDVPVGTVKSRLFRARQALREALESMDRPAGMIRPAEPGT
jgi:RNA polymerase sigma-70 factor (ECF subfamily)